MSNDNITITDLPPEVAGRVVYWSLGGHTDCGVLNNRIGAMQLPEKSKLKPPSPTVVTRRALQQIAAGNSRLFVRSAKTEPGFLLVAQDTSEGSDDFVLVVKAHADEKGLTATVFPNELGVKHEQVQDAYKEQTGRIDHVDISKWLIEAAADCAGVSLRPRGGLYFIPRGSVPRWMRYTACLLPDGRHNELGTIYALPAVGNDECVNAVFDALENDVVEFTNEINQHLDSGTLTPRIARNRVNNATTLLRKLCKYQDLLGERLNSLTEHVEKQKETAVILALSGDDD